MQINEVVTHDCLWRAMHCHLKILFYYEKKGEVAIALYNPNRFIVTTLPV